MRIVDTVAHFTRAKGGTVLPQQPLLTADEQKLNEVWNEHLRAEFKAHGADECTGAKRWSLNLGSERDWGFRTEQNPHLNGRAIPLPMGKVLGGGPAST